ncbi:hypothetical protein E1956_31365 [Paraburkholderia pallida]|uniref:Uncharacterized protein n=1 Tax=Paraburkholderia pallida TaxID=2547399 RepID=A0A4P7D4K5_9BURK|nr:hypothetical protein E1956_31365 [Paraburkholderia pallida]
MRHALSSATVQLLSMLRRWIGKVVNDATREVESIALDPNGRLREFASAVKTVALDAALPDTPARVHWKSTLLPSLGPALTDVRGYGAPEVATTSTRVLALCEQTARWLANRARDRWNCARR